MADIKISQLGAAIAVNDSDLLPIVSNGSTLKAPASLVKEYAVGDTDLTGIGDGTPTGAISALNTAKQPKTLDTPLTIGGVQKTTVEAALGGLNSESQSLSTALTNVESDIAPVEDGTKYSTSYTKGQQFIRGGKLYKITASSVNNTTNIVIKPTSGYNAELADNVTKQIGDVMSVTATINSDAFTGNILAKRIGKVLIVNFDITSKNDIASWTNVDIATLSGVTFTTWNTFSLTLQASNNYSVNGFVNAAGDNVIKLSPRTGSIASGNSLRGQLVAFVDY